MAIERVGRVARVRWFETKLGLRDFMKIRWKQRPTTSFGVIQRETAKWMWLATCIRPNGTADILKIEKVFIDEVNVLWRDFD